MNHQADPQPAPSPNTSTPQYHVLSPNHEIPRREMASASTSEPSKESLALATAYRDLQRQKTPEPSDDQSEGVLKELQSM